MLAILADIHANREAFDACLASARKEGARRFVFLGDLVGYGADPGYVVDTVRTLVGEGALALLGNHDDAVSGSGEGFTSDAGTAIAWTRGSLDADQKAFLAGLPITIESDGALFVHANGWAPREWGYVRTETEAERSMRRTRNAVTFCGHTHRPALFHMTRDKPAVFFAPSAGAPIPLSRFRQWLAVVGSVGQPRDRNPDAAYALYDPASGALTFMRVPYDIETAARKILAAGLPERLAARLRTGA